MAEHENKISYSSVTKICKKLKSYHYNIIKGICGEPTITAQKVHDSYEYPEEVETHQQKMEYGYFLHYLVYKFVYHLREEKAHTRIASKFVEKLEEGNYKIDALKNDFELVQKMKQAYSNFQAENTDPRNILPEIFVVSTFPQIEGGKMPELRDYNDNFINNSHMEAIFNYIRNLVGDSDVEVDVLCDCNYFTGEANLVFGDTIVDLRFSAKNTFYLSDFMKLILYSIGFYLSDGRRITKFIIYNMKTGSEHKLCWPNLQFSEVENFCEKYMKSRN